MEEKKLSYEELEKVARQLSEQNSILMNQLEQRNTMMMFKRIDYLFDVLKNNALFDYEFIAKCVAEIEEVLSKDEPEKKEEDAKTE